MKLGVVQLRQRVAQTIYQNVLPIGMTFSTGRAEPGVVRSRYGAEWFAKVGRFGQGEQGNPKRATQWTHADCENTLSRCV